MEEKKLKLKTAREKIMDFCRQETVLCAAVLLALLSMLFVRPDAEYINYVDFRTLAILFCLMGVMAGLRETGFFQWVAQKLLSRVKKVWQLVLCLVLLCFFAGMLVTNDVALITFVPFTFIILGLIGKKAKKRLLIPIVVLQTIAANLGSMLTPIGNPQNLYLYTKSGMSIGSFLLVMLPYVVLSLVLLLVWGILLGRRCLGTWIYAQGGVHGQEAEEFRLKSVLVPLSVYLGLFVACLLSVIHVLPWPAATGIVLAAVLIMDRRILGKVDYSLLLTFVGFFVFIGNVGRISAFRNFLQNVVENREVYAAIASSQVISNVPAALLLSGFTHNYAQLIIGVNLGGVGTLIASMASLISYKYVAKEETDRKGAYIAIFTVSSICFLTALMVLYLILAYISC